jgi:hypothetical protein
MRATKRFLDESQVGWSSSLAQRKVRAAKRHHCTKAQRRETGEHA